MSAPLVCPWREDGQDCREELQLTETAYHVVLPDGNIDGAGLGSSWSLYCAEDHPLTEFPEKPTPSELRAFVERWEGP